jgi:hypothetical protein
VIDTRSPFAGVGASGLFQKRRNPGGDHAFVGNLIEAPPPDRRSFEANESGAFAEQRVMVRTRKFRMRLNAKHGVADTEHRHRAVIAPA